MSWRGYDILILISPLPNTAMRVLPFYQRHMHQLWRSGEIVFPGPHRLRHPFCSQCRQFRGFLPPRM